MQVPAARRWLVACSLVVSDRHCIAIGMGGARDGIVK
jgi:hypothetical protein